MLKFNNKDTRMASVASLLLLSLLLLDIRNIINNATYIIGYQKYYQ